MPQVISLDPLQIIPQATEWDGSTYHQISWRDHAKFQQSGGIVNLGGRSIPSASSTEYKPVYGEAAGFKKLLSNDDAYKWLLRTRLAQVTLSNFTVNLTLHHVEYDESSGTLRPVDTNQANNYDCAYPIIQGGTYFSLSLTTTYIYDDPDWWEDGNDPFASAYTYANFFSGAYDICARHGGAENALVCGFGLTGGISAQNQESHFWAQFPNPFWGSHPTYPTILENPFTYLYFADYPQASTMSGSNTDPNYTQEEASGLISIPRRFWYYDPDVWRDEGGWNGYIFYDDLDTSFIPIFVKDENGDIWANPFFNCGGGDCVAQWTSWPPNGSPYDTWRYMGLTQVPVVNSDAISWLGLSFDLYSLVVFPEITPQNDGSDYLAGYVKKVVTDPDANVTIDPVSFWTYGGLYDAETGEPTN